MKRVYSRIFTELFPKRSTPRKKKKRFYKSFLAFLPSFLAFFLILFCLLLVMTLVILFSEYHDAKDARSKTIKQYQYWQEVVRAHPDYPDGYYKLASYAYILGEKNQALLEIQRSLMLDPSFEEAKRLEKKINTL